MTTTTASAQTPTVEQPAHPLPALATFELADYRHRLERAIRCYEKDRPAAPTVTDLRERLAEVIAEQDERARIATRNA
jgi:hypothetical protein